MALDTCDPRVFFAAERTMLAWLRTGLTIIAIGFVISRFGLFLHLLATQSSTAMPHAQLSIAAALGVAFVIIGSLVIAISAIQHRRFVTTLSQADLPTAYSSKLAFALAMTIAFLGITLAVYLWHS
jgi:putative membrane protein